MVGRRIRRSATRAAIIAKRAEPAEQAQRRQVGQHRHREPAGEHDRRQDQGGADQDGGPLHPDGGIFARLLLEPQPVEEVDGGAQGRGRTTPSAPRCWRIAGRSPSAHSMSPETRTGNIPGGITANITTRERKARPMKAAHEDDLDRQAEVQLLDHGRRCCAPRSPTGRSPRCHSRDTSRAPPPATCRAVSTTGSSCARVVVGNAAGDDDGVLVGRQEAAHQVWRQDVDILLEGLDIGDLPAFSASQRRSVSIDHTLPTPACFSRTVWTSAMVASVSWS